MIAVLDAQAVLEETERLNQLILQSEEVRRYQQSKMMLESDSEAQGLIREFVRKKEEFEDVQRFGRYHPDHDRIKKEMRASKRALDMNVQVARFKKAEKELGRMLADISKTIAHAVSDTIKVPTGNPFFDEAAIHGGCGSGGCSGKCANCGN